MTVLLDCRPHIPARGPCSPRGQVAHPSHGDPRHSRCGTPHVCRGHFRRASPARRASGAAACRQGRVSRDGGARQSARGGPAPHRERCILCRAESTHSSPVRASVEVCNDYSLWPHSGLASTSLASPCLSFFFPSYADHRQFPPNRVPYTSKRRRHGPRLHAHTPLRSSPDYARSASASARRALRPCDASRNSRPSSPGARWSSRGYTRQCRRRRSRLCRATAPSARCSSPRRNRHRVRPGPVRAR
jgi:hypothetical protein